MTKYTYIHTHTLVAAASVPHSLLLRSCHHSVRQHHAHTPAPESLPEAFFWPPEPPLGEFTAPGTK